MYRFHHFETSFEIFTKQIKNDGQIQECTDTQKSENYENLKYD